MSPSNSLRDGPSQSIFTPGYLETLPENSLTELLKSPKILKEICEKS